MIDEASVAELSPNAAQGDFFETADAFFSGDLQWTLAALRRHFFAGGDARPILAALQNRNRILVQVRALSDSGEARVGPRGIEGLQRGAATFGAKYGEAIAEKSSYNVFTQNPWYLGKLASSAKLPTLRRLIDNQRDWIEHRDDVAAFPPALGLTADDDPKKSAEYWETMTEMRRDRTEFLKIYSGKNVPGGISGNAVQTMLGIVRAKDSSFAAV